MGFGRMLKAAVTGPHSESGNDFFSSCGDALSRVQCERRLFMRVPTIVLAAAAVVLGSTADHLLPPFLRVAVAAALRTSARN